LLFIYIKK